MADTAWHKQTNSQPLFPDLLWSRPETKHTRGKLLIIGGNLYGLAAPAKAYEEAMKAGAGSLRLLLPESTKKLISSFQGPSLETVYAAATPSGSFAKEALGVCLEESAWADDVLFAGDLSRNSETAILLEKYLDKHTGQVTLVQDAVDYITNTPLAVHKRPNTTLVLTIAQLQKLFRQTKLPTAITMATPLSQLVNLLRDFHSEWGVNIVIKHHQQIIVVAEGQVSVTDTDLSNEDFWRIPTAAHVSVWWMQNPNKTFPAMCGAVLLSEQL